MITLQAYTAWHRAAARQESERRQEDRKTAEKRLARAEAYARWRWAGVQRGEVAAL